MLLMDVQFHAGNGFAYQGKAFVGGSGGQLARFEAGSKPTPTTVVSPPLPVGVALNIRAPIAGTGYVRIDNASSLAYAGTGDGSVLQEQFIAQGVGASGSTLPVGVTVILKSVQTGLYLRLVDASLYQSVTKKVVQPAPPLARGGPPALASKQAGSPPTKNLLKAPRKQPTVASAIELGSPPAAGTAVRTSSFPPPQAGQHARALPPPRLTVKAGGRPPPKSAPSPNSLSNPQRVKPPHSPARTNTITIPPAPKAKVLPKMRPPPRTRPPPRPHSPPRPPQKARGLLAVQSYAAMETRSLLALRSRRPSPPSPSPPKARTPVSSPPAGRSATPTLNVLAGTTYGVVADQSIAATATPFVFTGSGLSYNGRLMVGALGLACWALAWHCCPHLVEYAYAHAFLHAGNLKQALSRICCWQVASMAGQPLLLSNYALPTAAEAVLTFTQAKATTTVNRGRQDAKAARFGMGGDAMHIPSIASNAVLCSSREHRRLACQVAVEATRRQPAASHHRAQARLPTRRSTSSTSAASAGWTARRPTSTALSPAATAHCRSSSWCT
jgi:hypothetical protein